MRFQVGPAGLWAVALAIWAAAPIFASGIWGGERGMTIGAVVMTIAAVASLAFSGMLFFRRDISSSKRVLALIISLGMLGMAYFAIGQTWMWRAHGPKTEMIQGR